MIPVLPTQSLPDLAPVGVAAPSGPAPNAFERTLESVNATLKQADAMAAGYAQGKVGLTEAVLASERADVTFQFVMAVRSRALAAYQEIMNLQV